MSAQRKFSCQNYIHLRFTFSLSSFMKMSIRQFTAHNSLSELSYIQ